MIPLHITRVSYSHHDENIKGELLVYLKCRDLKGKRVNITVTGIKPSLWVDEDPGLMDLPDFASPHAQADFKSLDGYDLWQIDVEYPHQRSEVARLFQRTYSDDVPFEQIVRWTHAWRSVIEVDEERLQRPIRPIHIYPSEVDAGEFNVRCFTFDIETYDDKWYPPDKPDGRVVSIAIHDSFTDQYEIATTAPNTSERLVMKMLTNQETLHEYVEHDVEIPPLRPEQIKVIQIESGYDALPEYEDEETEAALHWWFKNRLKAYDPDVIIGHNLKGYDLPYLRNRCRIKNREIDDWRRLNPSRAKSRKRYPRIKWRDYASFDTMVAYSEQIQGAPVAAGMGSLHWMSGRELGYGKVPRTEIHKMFYNDPNLLAMYNIWDIVLPVRVMESMDLIGFYHYKTAFHDAPFDYTSSNMFLIESMLGHRLYADGVLMPAVKVVRKRIAGQKIESGGYVSDAKTGVWSKAFELDNSKEYPATIISGNLCVTTRIYDTSIYENGDVLDFPFDVTKTPNDTYYRRDFIGVMPTILKEMALGRDDVRAEMLEHEKGSKMWTLLNRKQRVMKENMNSFYGVLGTGNTDKTKTRPFRLAEPQIASDITKIAQEHEHHNKRYIEKAVLHFHAEQGVLVDEIEGSSRLEFEVLYQDTDSCKCCIKRLDEVEKEQRIIEPDEVLSIANILSIQLNESFHQFCQESLNVPRNEFFHIKAEEIYARYFQWGRKKRYAYRTLDGDDEFKGVEMKRSSVAPIVKKVQRAVFAAILDGKSKIEIIAIIKSLNDELLDAEQTPDIDFGRPQGLRSANESTQQAKAAKWSNRNLGTNFELGDKPVLFIASMGPSPLPQGGIIAIPYGEQPSDFRIVVNRDATIRKYFADSASMKAILEAVGVKWDDALQGVLRADFNDFFK